MGTVGNDFAKLQTSIENAPQLGAWREKNWRPQDHITNALNQAKYR